MPKPKTSGVDLIAVRCVDTLANPPVRPHMSYAISDVSLIEGIKMMHFLLTSSNLRLE